MNANNCVRCGKTLASPQSLWNHRQHCKDRTTKDNLHKTSGKGLIIKPRIGSTPVHKEKFIADIINNVRAKDQGSTSILPKERMSKMNSVLPKVLSDLLLDSEPDSDSESDSEGSVAEVSNDIEFMPDNPEELKAAFRSLYQKVHNNTKNYNKLVLMLDELQRMKCLTKEECNGVKVHLQEKIGIA